VLLHIGAADQTAVVNINGTRVAYHEGGYDAFTADITDHLSDINHLEIICFDDLENQKFPYGKQVTPDKRGGMWYTPVSGIWQTVWLESVPENYIHRLKIVSRGYGVTISTKPEMEGTVIIPGSYEGYPVCGIDERAFANCAELHTLRLTHVKDLGYSAFENCTALTDVDLGDSLTVIPSAAFRGCTALTTLNVPARITTIQNEAFASCTGLSYVTFENPHTWAIAMRDKQLITMNSPEQNAELLTDTYADNSFALEPTVQVQNLSLGVVDAEAYESGDYEGSIQYSWDQTMQRGKTCYWILDLDVSYLTKAKGSVNWGVYLDCTKDYDISIHEIIGVDTECYEAHYNDDTGRYAFYVEYGEQSFEPAHVRLVLQVTPVSGNRRMSLYVSGTCIMTEHGYVAESIDFIPEMDVSVW
jgi:hypothetical protein